MIKQRPMLNITIGTPSGKAGIISRQEWDDPGKYAVIGGQAAVPARALIEAIIGNVASPCDIQQAIMTLAEQPNRGITLLDVKTRPTVTITKANTPARIVRSSRRKDPSGKIAA